MKKLLIDANNLGYIAFHSTGGLRTNFQRTGVIFGFLKSVLMLAEKFKTNDFIFCWDSRKNKRRLVYPEYKNKRIKNLTEEEIRERQIAQSQFKQLRKEILPEIGFKNNLIRSGLESDDLMAMLAITKRNTLMISSDNDMYQILSFANMYSIQKKELISMKTFQKKYNIHPNDWVMAKSIGGCYTDNVEGIKGVSDPGKSTKSKSLAYVRGELKKGAIFDRIENNKDIIKRNLELIKLPYKDILYNFDLKENKFSKKKFLSTFDRFRFLTLIDKIDKWERAFIN